MTRHRDGQKSNPWPAALSCVKAVLAQSLLVLRILQHLLVLAVYHALSTGPLWHKTLLIIFYDEHGGFFDHVPPPEAHDDNPNCSAATAYGSLP